MRKRIAALVALAVSLGAVDVAFAADIPVKAPVYKTPAAVVSYNWSGFYIGGNMGAAWQRSCWVFLDPPVTDEGCHSGTDVVAGGQLGVNWQTGTWVFGLEASGNWANLKASSVSTGFPNFTNETRTNAIGLFTGRVGVAWNNTLAYVKGGAALTNNEYTAFVTASPSPTSITDTRWGWTVGGGLEYGFAPNWSAAVEYNYIDTGAKDEGVSGIDVFDRITQRIHMATVRVNYRFAPWIWR